MREAFNVKGFASKDKEGKPKVEDKDKKEFASKVKGYVDEGYFINLNQLNSEQKKQNEAGCPIGFVPNIKVALEEGATPEYQCLFKEYGLQISDLLEKSKSWTGPFVSLYASMLDFASFQNTNL